MRSEKTKVGKTSHQNDIELKNRFGRLEDEIDINDSQHEDLKIVENISSISSDDSLCVHDEKKNIKQKHMIHNNKDTNNSKQCKKRQCQVNFSKLLPEDLMIIPVTVSDRHITALVDSGASNNLVRDSIVKELGFEINSRETIMIRGLGNSEFRSLGKLNLV